MSWKKVKLGNLIQILSGFAFDSKRFNESNGIPIIRIRDIKRSYSETFYDGKFDNKYIVKKGDVLIGMDGEFNISEWKGIDSLLNQRVCKINSYDEKQIDKRYLAHFLPLELKYIEDKTSFVTVKHLSVKDINEIQIPLPPLATQQRIAAILDAADALRRKDQELLQKYDALAQAIFIDMFGDPVKNEKGWEVKKIKEFGKVQTGNTPSRAIKEYYGDFIEWIKTDNIILDKIYLTKATECLSKKGLAKGRSAESGSILVTCIAGSAKTIGNVALADRKVTFNQQINSLTPNSNYNSIFIYSLFRSCKPIIQGNTTQGMKRIITKSVFEKLELISPPKHLQDEYEQKYLIFLRNKEILNYQVNISENLFQTLLQKSFKAASE